MAAAKTFLAWSYSRLDLYLLCPLRAKLKNLDKLPEPPAPALENGTRVHKLCEDYLKGLLPKLPKDLSKFAKLFKELRKLSTHLKVEAELAFDKNWQPVSWFARDCYCRIKMDVLYGDVTTGIWHVIDWKTGKVNPKHIEQLELYAIGAFLTCPASVKRVDTRLCYLDSGEEANKTFMRTELPALQAKWSKLAKPMLADKTFKPKPSSNSCRFCNWTKAKGGPCKF